MTDVNYIIFHNSFDKIAGTERVIYNLLEFLSDFQNRTVTLLLASESKELALSLAHLPVNVVYLGAEIEADNALKLLSTHAALYKRLSNHLKTYDKTNRYVCLATNPFLALLIKLLANRFNLDIVVISCEHFSLSVSGKPSLITRKLFYRNVYVVTLTQQDKEAIEQKYHPKKCVCIPNASPFEITSYNNSQRDKTILSIGRLANQKGFDLLIRSFALIAEKHPDWKLQIIGDDYGEKNYLLGLIDKFALKDSVSLIPATKHIANYYKSSGFYVLSSRFEGLPMVLIEALSFGMPIVAFDCPTGPAEIVNDHNGLLVKNGNIYKLADAMSTLMMSQDVLLTKAVGAEHDAAAFRKDKINKLWSNLFTSI
jgi:glycosyltransferase involved in cell wall biosynthesis